MVSDQNMQRLKSPLDEGSVAGQSVNHRDLRTAAMQIWNETARVGQQPEAGLQTKATIEAFGKLKNPGQLSVEPRHDSSVCIASTLGRLLDNR
jgi:hypothetical protein